MTYNDINEDYFIYVNLVLTVLPKGAATIYYYPEPTCMSILIIIRVSKQ